MHADAIRLDNVILRVPDVRAAVAWYCEHTGLRPVVDTEEVAVLHPRDDGAGIILRLDVQAPSRTTVWFEVDDAAELADELGLPTTDLATGLLVEVDDPWGNTVGFTDYSRRPELGGGTGHVAPRRTPA